MASSKTKNVVEENNVSQPVKTEKKEIFALGSIDNLWHSLLGLALPFVGIIWALVWRKSHPSQSKSMMVASLFTILVSLVVALFVYIILVDFGHALFEFEEGFIREWMSKNIFS